MDDRWKKQLKGGAMAKEEVSKPVKKARWLVIGTNVVFIGAIFATLVYRSDPLSRYPYGTTQQREVMAEHFTHQDIDILINSQIRPEQILPFMDMPGFDINNTIYYDLVSKTQSADPDFIVQFVNRYRDRLNVNNIQEMLSWMSYPDIVAYFDSKNEMPLSKNPEGYDFYLDPKTTLASWRPSDLVQVQDLLSLRKTAAEHWELMKQAAASEGVDLKAISGFVAYENQRNMTEYKSMPLAPYGSREEQLGLTLYLDGYDLWNQTLSATEDENYDFNHAINALSDQQRLVRDWVELHAAQYGFILRYPQGKEQETKVLYQPFVLRYVGVDVAENLKINQLCLEEYQAQGEEHGN